MTRYSSTTNTEDVPAAEDWTLSVGEIWDEFLRLKLIVLAIFVVFIAGGAVYAFLAQPLYRISASLIPAENASSLLGGKATGTLGALASLAGADLGGGGNQTVEALAVMRSRRFTIDFIKENSLMPRLFPEQWDAANNEWKGPKEDVPTYARAYAYFDRKVRKLSEDKKTGIVTLSIDWFDRAEAVSWAEDLIRRVNEEMRARTIAESTASLERLEQQASRTAVVAIQLSLAQLIEAEIRRKTLATVRQDFVFRVVDPPSMPDRGDILYPKKPFLIVVCLGAASLLSTIIIMLSALMRIRRIDEQK
jgi:uncharacterized protein involved in exopolysaccharide biosynthesis